MPMHVSKNERLLHSSRAERARIDKDCNMKVNFIVIIITEKVLQRIAMMQTSQLKILNLSFQSVQQRLSSGIKK